jgi:hypothetical protein
MANTATEMMAMINGIPYDNPADVDWADEGGVLLNPCDCPTDFCVDCQECDCLDVHSPDECNGKEFGCNGCHPIDQFVHDKVQADSREIWENMWGWSAKHWSKQFAEYAKPSKIVEAFKNADWKNKSTKIKFRRYGTFQAQPNSHVHDALAYGMGVHKFETVEDTQMKVIVDLAGKRRVGHVVKPNDHTVWVKIMKGAQTYDIIKRHRDKHNVKFYTLGELNNG